MDTPSCLYCNTPIIRKRSGVHDKLMYCSKGCSNRGRAGKIPSRKAPEPRCVDCGGRRWYGSDWCRNCKREQLLVQTLAELRKRHGLLQFHAKVRGYARDVYQGPKTCAACGYDLHVDICHIRDVANFPPEATVAEVNASTNLVALDKRCHWEFDHGYLRIDGSGAFVAAVPD